MYLTNAHWHFQFTATGHCRKLQEVIGEKACGVWFDGSHLGDFWHIYFGSEKKTRKLMASRCSQRALVYSGVECYRTFTETVPLRMGTNGCAHCLVRRFIQMKMLWESTIFSLLLFPSVANSSTPTPSLPSPRTSLGVLLCSQGNSKPVKHATWSLSQTCMCTKNPLRAWMSVLTSVPH